MDVERIIRTHVSSGDQAVPSELLQALQDGRNSLVDVVKALGEYLTSTDDDIRARGVKLLTEVIGQVPVESINRQATQTLTIFLTSLLSDGHTLPSTLTALIALGRLSTFGDGEAVGVYRGIVENVTMRSFVQSTRHLVFVLIDQLLARHRSALLSLKTDFTASYVKLAEGEKDPRNLMLAFGIGRVILIDFDEYLALEDMFDIIFCYFPITFKPPPDDPYGITPADLKLALRGCMAANPRFAPLAMPLFVEKLGPSLGMSKRDVLQSLEACLPVYGATGLEPFAKDLWDGLKTEILYSPDTDIERDALQTFQVLIKVFYPDGERKTTELLKAVVKECQDILKEPEKSKAKPATKMLGACITASAFVGTFALAQILPQLFRAYRTESEIPHRGAILVVISELLHSLREVYTGSERHQTEERSIEVYRDELLSLLTSGLDNSSPTVKTPALAGIVNLAHIPGFLTAEEMSFVVQRVNPMLLDITPSGLRAEAIEALRAISLLISKPVEDSTLPLLFGRLPDIAPGLDQVEDRFRYLQILESLSDLCVSPSLFEMLVVRVLSKLDVLTDTSGRMEVDGDEGDVQNECNVAYAYSLLDCMLRTLRKKIAAKHQDVGKYFDQVIPRIFGLCLLGIHSTQNRSSVTADTRILSVCASIVELLTQVLSAERQAEFAQVLFNAYWEGGVADVARRAKHAEQVTGSAVLPFATTSSLREQNLIILYSAGIVALRGVADALSGNPSAVLSRTVLWIVDLSPNERLTTSASKSVASMVNKLADALTQWLTDLDDRFWPIEIMDASAPIERRRRALEVWIWIAKALAVRNHPTGIAMLKRVFELLGGQDTLAEYGARKLSILSNPSFEAVMAKENHASFKALHKQKLANYLLPTLIQGCGASDRVVQRTFMTALGSLVRLIPRSLVTADLQQILPMLMRSLALSDPESKANVLEALISVCEVEDSSANEAIQRQAKGLVERLLIIAVESDAAKTTPRTRTAALRCLGVFPDAVRYDVLQGIKAKVVRDLQIAVDDPKRAVRKEAVDTRAKWIRFGASS